MRGVGRGEVRGAGRVGYRERRGEGAGTLVSQWRDPASFFFAPSKWLKHQHTSAEPDRVWPHGGGVWQSGGVAVWEVWQSGGVAVWKEGQAETHRT